MSIIRTYVRTVKNLRVRGRGERIPSVVTAIVLIAAERSAIAKLGPALADVPGVAEAYSVTGEFDFVVIVRVKNHEEIADVVTSLFFFLMIRTPPNSPLFPNAPFFR